jgi:hypothetical protein
LAVEELAAGGLGYWWEWGASSEFLSMGMMWSGGEPGVLSELMGDTVLGLLGVWPLGVLLELLGEWRLDGLSRMRGGERSGMLSELLNVRWPNTLSAMWAW